MRAATIVALAALSSGSVALAQQAAPPAPPPTDWIEVALPAGVFREHGGDYRSDVIDIPIRAGGELEYKLDMREGDSIVYRWNAVEMSEPRLLYSEFHGHTERVGGSPGTLMFYRKANGGEERGALVAPFTGIHGWYLKNESTAPIVVRLHVAGFYKRLDE